MYFIYKNRSSEEFGLKIISINDISSPERNIEMLEVKGRNGDLIFDHGNYKNFELKFECDVIPHLVNKSLIEIAREMKVWLQSDFSYNNLVISYDLDTYYEAVCINQLDIERVAKDFGYILLKFNCKPYKKLKDNVININKQNTSIINNYEISYPNIKIFGQGDITLKLNKQEIVLKDVEEHIIIDSDLMNTYKESLMGQFINQNNKMFSDFPILEKGANEISWVGAVDKIEITPRWAVI